jgi:hypothetical protein
MAAPGAVRLEYNYEKNEKVRYKISISSEQSITDNDTMTPNNFTVEMLMSGTAFEVLPDDTYAIQYIVESGSMMQGDKKTRLPNLGQFFIMEISKSGEVMNTSFNLPFTQPAFPDRSLSVGSSWEDVTEISFPFKDKNLKVPYVSLTYTYTLKELSSLAGQECAVITVTCPETTIQVKDDYELSMSGSGKIYFAHHEGKLLGSYIKNTQLITTQGTEISTKLNTKVELVA